MTQIAKKEQEEREKDYAKMIEDAKKSIREEERKKAQEDSSKLEESLKHKELLIR